MPNEVIVVLSLAWAADSAARLYSLTCAPALDARTHEALESDRFAADDRPGHRSPADQPERCGNHSRRPQGDRPGRPIVHGGNPGNSPRTHACTLAGSTTGPAQKTPRKSKHTRHPWVQVALPELRVFQAVVPITGANRSSPPQAYFMEAVRATNQRAEERVIELVKLELDKQPLACLVASPRPVITGLIALLEGIGTRVALIESAPAGLFALERFSRKRPGVQNYVFGSSWVGPRRLVCCAGHAAVLWHTFDLPAEDLLAAIMATYSTLWMQGRHCRIHLPIDTVVIHGRPELELAIKPDVFRERTGARLSCCDEPGYELVGAAFGTALADLLTETNGLNLAASSNRQCRSGRSCPGASWPSRRH